MPRGLVIFAMLASLALDSCDDSKDAVKKDSPLFLPVVQIYPHESWERRIGDAVVRQLPIGSKRPQIEEFIHKNFIGVRYEVTTHDDSRALAHPTEPHVFIRAADQTRPGIFQVEIYLMLTSDETLQNVVVRTSEAYP